ncbi:MAG: PKD domain-containing protein, partial [Bacteroidota bacterium]
IYANPGTYNVILMVVNTTTHDTAYDYETITVYQPPVAGFTVAGQSDGCVPLSITFTNTTVPGDGTTLNYSWDFYDGGTSSQTNPVYVFTSPGSWNVSLQVEDNYGCQDDFIINGAVFASDIINDAFHASVTSYCNVPLAITFYDDSQGNPPFTYEWDFGDGNTSASASPVTNTYDAEGTYDVTMIISDSYGCSDTVYYEDYISLNEVVASFDVSGSGIGCINQPVGFINTSGINCTWDFGDGAVSNIDDPTHAYVAPGFYTVTLIAAPGDTCADTTFQIVEVEEVIAGFYSDPTESCEVPFVVNYYDTSSTNVVDWVWHFGNGTTGTGITPTNTYYSPGSYSDTLFVTTANGCTDVFTIQNNIFIDLPVANFTGDPNNGCAPLTVNFTDNSSCSIEPITSWQWTFPGGTPATYSGSTSTVPPVVFDPDGEYLVQLIITTGSGCSDTATYEIQVGSHQHLEFVASRDTVCASDTISFINTSTDTSLIDTWNWLFSTEFEPVEMYVYNDEVSLDTGYATITLISEYNGCYDTLVVDSAFYVQGPIVHSIDWSFDCDSPYVWTFETDITAGEYWDWDFTDGTVLLSSTLDSVVHTYLSTGNDTVYVTAYNSQTGCTFDTLVTFRITDVQAVLTYNDTVCNGATAYFSGATSQDPQQYYWDFGDGDTQAFSTTPTASHIYPASGLYTVMLVVQDMHGCRDTAYGDIFISAIQIGLMVDTLIGCAPLEVNFIDVSYSDVTLTTWSWSFGAGGGWVVLTTNDTMQYIYNNEGTYLVQHTIKDVFNCSDDTSITIKVIESHAGFSVNDTVFCIGDTVEFVSSSTGNDISWFWDFGNGDSSLLENPYYLYGAGGDYDVQLIVIDTMGCSDTLFIDSLVQIQDIYASFSVSNTDTNCYPFLVHCYNYTPDNFNNTYNWTFGDGTYSVLEDPSHTYAIPGDYTLIMTATTSNGCSDQDTTYIHVGGPYGQIVSSEDTICLFEQVIFTLTDTSNMSTYYWTFGDGDYYAGSNGVISHYYNSFLDTLLPINVIYESDSGCQGSDVDTIYMFRTIADFSRGPADLDFAGCSPYEVVLINNSVDATNWDWDLGFGQQYIGFEPDTQIYTIGGFSDTTIFIQLVVWDNHGCIDSISKDLTIYAHPQITVSNDDIICRGDGMTISVWGGNYYLWSPSDGLDNTLISNPYATPDSTTTYVVSVTDLRGCSNSDSVQVFVQQEPNVDYSPDTTIIIGEIAPLYISADQANVSYLWSPQIAISCTTCSNPIVMPLTTTEYTVVYEDSLQCFSPEVHIIVQVIDDYSLDMPLAFTPNGDGINDIVYVRGWGIKNLMEFKVYDRWGQLIFFTDDIRIGWDGTYKGTMQNIDTYAYYVKAMLYNGNTIDKKGTISLLK